MSRPPVQVQLFAITREQLENLASEFFGFPLPAPGGAMVHMRYDAAEGMEAEDLHMGFLRALESYRIR